MFKAYDARGVYGEEVTEAKFFALGKTLSAAAGEVVLGTDYRKHNPSLANAFANGFDGEIRFLGFSPTAATAFYSEKTGLAVTASHNPPEYAGAKPLKERRMFFPAELNDLKNAYYANEGRWQNPVLAEKKLVAEENALGEYEASLPEFSENAFFDLGGGAACVFAKLFAKKIFDTPDPEFACRPSEPKPEALEELKRLTREENALGLALDGDADRVAAVDCGEWVDGSIVGAFLASRELKKGDAIVTGIDNCDEVQVFLENEGFNVFVSPVGDVNVGQEAFERRAAFSMERGGHYAFLKHLVYPDGLYAAALLSQAKLGELREFAKKFSNHQIVSEVKARANFALLEKRVRAKQPEALSTVDGVKARFDGYCFLIRSSNTEPKIRINVEAKTKELAGKGLKYAQELLKKCFV